MQHKKAKLKICVLKFVSKKLLLDGKKSCQTASWGSGVAGAQRTKDRRAILISINRPILLYHSGLTIFFPLKIVLLQKVHIHKEIINCRL